METLNVRLQVLMAEKFVKERSTLGVGRVKLLKLLLNARRWHAASVRRTETLGGICSWGNTSKSVRGGGCQQVPLIYLRRVVGVGVQMAASTNPRGLR
jgi:hypothetical protein